MINAVEYATVVERYFHPSLTRHVAWRRVNVEPGREDVPGVLVSNLSTRSIGHVTFLLVLVVSYLFHGPLVRRSRIT